MRHAAAIIFGAMTAWAAQEDPLFAARVASLNEVAARGARLDATAEEWLDMHRAYDALIEIYVSRKESTRAGNMASLQSMMYRSKDRNYKAALDAARRALDLHGRGGGPYDESLDWSAIGQNLASLGETDAALIAFATAKGKAANPYSANTANLRREIVLAEIARKNVANARREAEEFLRDAVPSAPPVFHATGRIALSDVLIEEENYDGGLKAAAEALRIADGKAGAESVVYAANFQAIYCLLMAARYLPYTDALAMAKRVTAEFPKLPVPAAPFAAQVIEVRRRLAGDFNGLLKDKAEALEKARQSGGDNAKIAALRAMATLYSSLNAWRQSALLLEEAAVILRQRMKAGKPDAGSEITYLSVLNALGNSRISLGEVERGRRAFEEAIRYCDSTTGDARTRLLGYYGSARFGKARVAEIDDDAEGARDELLTIEKNAKAWRTSMPALYAALARVEKVTGRAQAARTYYEKAIEAAAAARDRRGELRYRMDLAAMLVTQKKDPDAARKHLEVAAKQAETFEHAAAKWKIDWITGQASEAGGSVADAILHYKRAASELESLRQSAGEEDLRRGVLDDASAEDLYQRLIALLVQSGRIAEAWDTMQRAKARTFLEAVTSRRAATTSTGEQAAGKGLETEIAGLRLQLEPQQETVLRAAGREPGLVRGRLKELEAKLALERQQASILTSGGPAMPSSSISMDEVRRQLAPGVALVEYTLLPNGLGAFVCTRQECRHITWNAARTELKRNASQLRGRLADANSDPEPLLGQVSKVLLDPIAPMLSNALRELIIVPSSFLSQLPFGILRLPGGAVLADRYAIRYLPATALLLRSQRRTDGRGTLFLGALGGEAVEGMSPLPGTLRETDAIANSYPKARRVVESEFTHDEVLRSLESHSMVHLATHGILEEQAPLFSALLTGHARGQSSRVNLYEIAGLRLKNRLIVLSACETGLGRLRGGDEITGLTRVFLEAGASAVISSLWKVSDDSTALLMAEFYRELKRGRREPEALRAASLAVRQKFPHPFYWAPFILTGAR
ncbi:MAG: CHAT domain-containing protein [Candidatus Solibacter usitatus]|nr:CHAT domain-containing protein [Candidatus Solibacter usitatus]